MPLADLEGAAMTDVNTFLVRSPALSEADTVQNWAWLLPAGLRLHAMNLFGDLFLLDKQGAVHAFWLTSCQTEQIAWCVEEFDYELSDPGKRALWLVEPVVNQLHSQGIIPGVGRCYGWKVPPWLGGDVSLANVAVFPIGELHGAYSQLYRQVHDLPDGAEVVIKIKRTD
jgi:hypothetical protein